MKIIIDGQLRIFAYQTVYQLNFVDECPNSPGSVKYRKVPLTALIIIIAGPGVSREIYCELGEHKMGQNWKV